MPRDWSGGLRALSRWVRNPVSEDGAMALNHVTFAIGGPEIVKRLEQMTQDPVACRVLHDRPDLSTALSDMAALAALPPGTFGRAYHDFMSHPAVIPTALLASLLYRDGTFDALDWDDDMKYLVDRMAHTHDLTHVLSGYTTDLPGEALNIAFIIGIDQYPAGHTLTEAFSALTGALFWPTVGVRRWHRLLREAYDRGAGAAQTRPLGFLYFEELLAQPLATVRAQLGIRTPRTEVTTSEAWLRNPLGRAMAHGYGQTQHDPDELAALKHLLAARVPARDLVRTDPETLADLIALGRRRAPVAEIHAVHQPAPPQRGPAATRTNSGKRGESHG